jgi:hypothetical protein
MAQRAAQVVEGRVPVVQVRPVLVLLPTVEVEGRVGMGAMAVMLVRQSPRQTMVSTQASVLAETREELAHRLLPQIMVNTQVVVLVPAVKVELVVALLRRQRRRSIADCIPE